ncbi:MAG: MarR family transcriptional regulator [Gammaproteobacteria bacterium]
MQEFEQSLPMMLYRAIDTVLPRFRLIFSEYGLTETQWRVLRVLWEQDTVTLKELSISTLIPAPSLVGVVDRLENQGLVIRQRDQRDRRQVFIRATERGQELEALVSPKVEATYQELRCSLKADTWQGLMFGLQQLTATPDLHSSPTAQRQSGAK